MCSPALSVGTRVKPTSTATYAGTVRVVTNDTYTSGGTTHRAVHVQWDGEPGRVIRHCEDLVRC